MGTKDLGAISDFTLPWSFLCSSTDDHGAFYKGCLATRGSSKTAMCLFGVKHKTCEMSGNVSFGCIYCQQVSIDASEILLLNNMGHMFFHGSFKYNVNIKVLLVVIHPYHQTKWGVSEALDTSTPVSIAVYR